LLASQDLPPYEPQRRDVASRQGHYGLGQLKANLANDELAFVEAVIKAFRAAKADSDALTDGPFDDAVSATPPTAAMAEHSQSAQADSVPHRRRSHPGVRRAVVVVRDRQRPPWRSTASPHKRTVCPPRSGRQPRPTNAATSSTRPTILMTGGSSMAKVERMP
jgi:hypothetical protein